MRLGFCTIRLPFNDGLKFFSGAGRGQAVQATIDTVPANSVATRPRKTEALYISTPISCVRSTIGDA
jgi:hypothetical protein